MRRADILAKRAWTLRDNEICDFNGACVDKPACNESANYVIRGPRVWSHISIEFPVVSAIDLTCMRVNQPNSSHMTMGWPIKVSHFQRFVCVEVLYVSQQLDATKNVAQSTNYKIKPKQMVRLKDFRFWTLLTKNTRHGKKFASQQYCSALLHLVAG